MPRRWVTRHSTDERHAHDEAHPHGMGCFSLGLAGRPRAGALERGWLWCKRNPWLAGAIGTTTAASVAVAVISLVFALEQTKAKDQIKGPLVARVAPEPLKNKRRGPLPRRS